MPDPVIHALLQSLLGGHLLVSSSVITKPSIPFVSIHPQLTILLSGQCPQRWSLLGKCPRTPFCFQRGSGPGRKACCHSQTSSRTPQRPSAARPYHTGRGLSDCQCWSEKVWYEGRKQNKTRVQLWRQMAALTAWPAQFCSRVSLGRSICTLCGSI